ncbi:MULTISPECIES: thiolase family protein [Cycloclasticus]|uniref:3-ketoacyl-CoA thiolase n=1 Tax=Cycloclasticus pugetii TaxID=34068 RepID=A0AB33Z3U9_9GAMM|nr:MULTISPECIES: thiolase family protein [Cycloclasticus]ATI03632.1 acetyl-CoA C-acyltransferase [Cycloclasticus sp. PY97N]EPD14121.1 3-ketoacyl-CoA thiolase [Cycloclasticus pugetii]
MKNVVIAAYVRSPQTFAHKGALATLRPDTLVSQVIAGLVSKTGIDSGSLEDIIMGCAFPEGEQGLNIARLSGLMAGIPNSVAGVTVNRFCGSSMQAIHMAAGAIQMNAGEAFICAGVESMSRIPMGGYNPMPNPALFNTLPAAYISMGETAENVAKQYQLSRSQQDEFAIASQQKAAAAQQQGRFKDEIIPIDCDSIIVEMDGCIRANTSIEEMAGLKPAFSTDGTVTAANSSPLTDGASATLVCSEEYAIQNKLTPLARINSIAVSGCAPKTMGLGPIFATKKALQRASLTITDIDIIEINEAFASQSIACIQELKVDINRVNIDGGAIALGHPLGATGARITGKAAALLKRENKHYALATQCIGGGQGIATILESL